jgi:hypothetical protein
MKRIKHKIGLKKGHNEFYCVNCYKKLLELTQELIDADNPEYNDLNKIVINHSGYRPDTLQMLLNLIEKTSTCITEDEATVKDIIE